MRVSVFGLGYVGAISSGCFAQDGLEVIGVDLSPDKVRLINEGTSPIVEEKIGEIIASAVASGRLRATTDTREAVLATDVSVISVGTPSAQNGAINLSAMERVCQDIGAAVAQKPGRHLVVVRSTVMPGTVRSLVIPTLEKASRRTLGDGLGVCFNPEFLREASSVKDHYDPPYTVIGRVAQRDGDEAAQLYAKVDAEVIFTSLETAEMVKYVCNAFHALKATFANEMGILGRTMGVDTHEVMDIMCRDTKLNISPRYLRPGAAFGGSCLPKDVRALCYKAKVNDLRLPLTDSMMVSNRMQMERPVEAIVALGRKKISVLGLSFKAGTDDLRESPLVNITEALIGKGYNLRIYDRNISVARLVGANKAYIEKEIPHLSSLLVPTLEDAVEHGEVLLIGNAAPEFSRLATLCRGGQTVFDMVKIPGLQERKDLNYVGVAW